jgi:putative FmdB family regulatory protein
MPTYEYVCKECGHRFETKQSMKDEPLTACPQCGGELRKVLHAAGLVFKGSGFYATDNRAKPKESTGSSDAKKSGDGGSGSDKKKDGSSSKDTGSKSDSKSSDSKSDSGSSKGSDSGSKSSGDSSGSSGTSTKKKES